MSLHDPHPLRAALDKAEPKPAPDGKQADKKNYAQRLSSELAIVIADALRPHFPDVTPTVEGKRLEDPVATDQGSKRLDVKVWHDQMGLVLSVSIKTYSFRDFSPQKKTFGRWVKNIVRNDHELRAEANVVHRRQPYAVLVGLMFEPAEICDDGHADSTQSSFAHHVRTLRKRTGRGRWPVETPTGEQGGWVHLDAADDTRHELFERVFIGLYEYVGDNRGAVRFFDVEQSAPHHSRPADSSMITLDRLVELVVSDVERRNRTAEKWADES